MIEVGNWRTRSSPEGEESNMGPKGYPPGKWECEMRTAVRSGRRRQERGAALVEMALVLPLLIMLLLGIFAAARGWQVHNVLDHAAREAARYGATLDPWDENAAKGVAIAEIQVLDLGPHGAVDNDHLLAKCLNEIHTYLTCWN